jgi:hypothetical protein
MAPGVYPGLSMAEYLAIPALSSGVARDMVDQCPAKAWFGSWLNPQRVREDTHATDRGTIAHAALLEGSFAGVAVIDPADHPAQNGNIPDGWTNKAIRDARDSARAAGKIPILKADFAECEAMVNAASDYIAHADESEVTRLFTPAFGESEVTMVWKEGETLCKLRADRISLDRTIVCDYKTTDASADPDRWGRTQLVNMGYYFQAAWYRRGVAALNDGRVPAFIFLAQECSAPYLCSLIGCDPAMIDAGDAKVAVSIKRWQRCARDQSWPGYPSRIAYPELPAFELARVEEMEIEGGL